MITKQCEICQHEFDAVQKKEKYCSDECYKEARRRQARTPTQRARGARKKQRQRDRDPEHQKQLLRDSRARHRDKRNAETEQWFTEHPGAKARHSKTWRDKHPEEKRADSRSYYAANRKAVLARTSVYAKTHPEVLQKKNSRRRALLANAEGYWTVQEFLEKCEALDYCCFYCHVQTGKLTVDHVIPLSRGGTNWIENIVPACESCNYSKQDKTGEEYMSVLKCATS
jgi:5-methylcytosine-specific restriction endonuclease McrA